MKVLPFYTGLALLFSCFCLNVYAQEDTPLESSSMFKEKMPFDICYDKADEIFQKWAAPYRMEEEKEREVKNYASSRHNVAENPLVVTFNKVEDFLRRAVPEYFHLSEDYCKETEDAAFNPPWLEEVKPQIEKAFQKYLATQKRLYNQIECRAALYKGIAEQIDEINAYILRIAWLFKDSAKINHLKKTQKGQQEYSMHDTYLKRYQKVSAGLRKSFDGYCFMGLSPMPHEEAAPYVQELAKVLKRNIQKSHHALHTMVFPSEL